MKPTLLLFLLLVSLSAFSQSGRIRQTTTIVIWYEILPDNGYDIYVRNAASDTSVIQVIYKDSTFSVRLANWEKYHWRVYEPKGFTLFARNMSNYFGKWEECGSKRDITKVGINIVKSPAYTTDCTGKLPYEFFVPDKIKK